MGVCAILAVQYSVQYTITLIFFSATVAALLELGNDLTDLLIHDLHWYNFNLKNFFLAEETVKLE